MVRRTGFIFFIVAVMLAAGGAHAAAGPVIRIGIVMPKAQLGQGNTAEDVGEPLRQLLMSYMSGPALEVVPIQSRIPVQVEAEAQQLNCTHLLYSSVEQKKGGKGLGKMLGALAPAAGMLTGMGGSSGAAGAMIANTAAQAAMQSAQEDAIASLTQAQAGGVKARDELSLTYQLVAVGGAKPLLNDTLKAKAKNDGDNLLGPLVEQVATAAVGAALAK